jgi:hypothetical protein
MRRNQQHFLGLGISILGVLTLSPVLLGQASPDSGAGVSVPNDWSHQHVIFSRPATAEQARRVQQDPRYRQQLARHAGVRLPVAQGSEDWASEGWLSENAPLPGRNGIKGDWSLDMGINATVGAGNYAAKYSFGGSTASCAGDPQPDFVVYSTGLTGAFGQANVVAYDNLYSGCGGIVPTVYWAYNTGGATILTSPVFSLDGTQIAWVQKNAAGHGVLNLVKWAPSTTETITSPTALGFMSATAYLTCTAPCRTAKVLQQGGTSNADTNSSVFYDYRDDTAYVGDDAGWLHKFTPVFNGSLTEVGGAWPVRVNPGSPTALNSPVYDGVSGNVFVTDKGGYIYWVSSAGAVTQSGQLDFSTATDSGPGMVQGPIVDSTAGVVYVFATSDGSGGCPIGIAGSDCSVVYSLNTTFSAGDVPPRAIVGTSTREPATPSPLYIGAFDSTYENSSNATGNLYVCGNTGGDPVLYQVAIAAGSFGTVTAGPVLSTSIPATPCSPVTDIRNPNVSGGATEWIFASTATFGSSSACGSGGCIFNFKDTPWKPSTGYTVGQEVLDSHFQIQVVSVAGTSGATAPSWSTTLGSPTLDGTVIWLDQGLQSAFTPAAWVPSHLYALHSTILDGNGNIQLATTAGTSGGSSPTFNSTAGGITLDAPPLVWTNVGAIPTASMSAAGGTSGIIVDNTVETLLGASQVYFSTLTGEVCVTSGGTGGCAVQASQSELQ